jgi:hypothetical protein
MFSLKAHCCALTFEVKSDLNLDLHKFEMNYIVTIRLMQSRVARDFLV